MALAVLNEDTLYSHIMNIDKMPTVLFSNSLELLLSRLKKNILECPQDPFYRIQIIVSDVHVKTVLQLELAKAKGVVFGLEVTTILEMAQKASGLTFLDLCIAAMSTGANPEAAVGITNELAQQEWFGCSKDAEVDSKCQLAKEQLRPCSAKTGPPPNEIHLFGVSALCPKVNDLLFSSPHVAYYVLSPCMHFWSDICSDQEAKKLTRRLHTKHSQALQGYLYERSKLLANNGTRAREFISYLEDKLHDFEEAYVLKEWVSQDAAYSEYIREDVVSCVIAGPPTLFDVIQNDLLLMGRKSETKLAFTKTDTTVQIHKAPTLAREVEVLYQYIQQILPTTSGRIVVYAPDIEVYKPYIKSLFTQNVEVVAPPKRELLPSFLQILDMAHSRASPKKTFELFQIEAFRKKCGIEFEDLQLLATVLQQFDVGYASFKEQVVLSWISSSLQALEITSSDAEVLGKCLQTLESLFGDIQSLQANKTRLCLEWQRLFLEIFEKYFEPSRDERDEFYTIKQALIQTCQNETLHNLGPIDQERALSIFKVAIQEQDEQRTHPCLASIIFATLGDVRTLPRDVVCLLGMHEGSFPRSNSGLLRKLGFLHPSKPPYTVSSLDRHLIIEAILTTSSMLYISYQSYGFKERSFLEPSGIVLDILETLDLACTVDHDMPSKVLIRDHPLESCREGLFACEVPAASIHLQSVTNEQIDVMYIHELSQVAKYPMRAYMQHGLGLYMREFKARVRSSEFEVLDPRNLGMAKKQAFVLPQDSVHEYAQKEYRFLPPVLKAAACQLLDEDVVELRHNAKALGIKADEPLQIELSLTCKSIQQVDIRSWRLPALTVDVGDKQVKLAGVLPNIYPKGLALCEKRSKDALFKVWPELLLMSVLASDLPIEPNVLFVKDAKVEAIHFDDAKMRLKEYVQYALDCRKTPSGLYPDWVEVLCNQEFPPDNITERSEYLARDPYLDLYLSRVTWQDFQGQWQRWRQQALQMYKPRFGS